jgi:hypothetical protein
MPCNFVRAVEKKMQRGGLSIVRCSVETSLLVKVKALIM